MNESRLKSSVVLRMILIAGLSLALLIPAVYVESLIWERQERRDAVFSEISNSWGKDQLITGLILTIPYKRVIKNHDGSESYTREMVYILPEQMSIKVSLIPVTRYRGIYEAILYTANISCEGTMAFSSLAGLHLPEDGFQWNEAFLTLGISDVRGIKDSIILRWDSTMIPSKPIPGNGNMVGTGVMFNPSVNAKSDNIRFSFHFTVNGSGGFRVVPVGKQTNVTMNSSWRDPNFIGAYLPDSRTVDERGFQAVWSISYLTREFPQTWVDTNLPFASSGFGVHLLLPVDEYQKNTRAIKYAILFISLTFLLLFLIEVTGKIILHPIQYALIGFAILLFYVLLLSFSEYVPFNIAYLLSSVSIIALITIYAGWITAKKHIAIVTGGVLTFLYSFLFITLQLQDYALLFGSIGLFFILGAVMYLTRKIDWFSLGKEKIDL